MLSVARVLVLIGALSIVAVGLLGGSIGILAGFLEPNSDLLMMVTISVSFLALTVGLGSVLAWHAWQASRGQTSRPFRPKRIWALGLLFLLAVLLGQLVLMLDLLPPLTFPPLHVIAAVLPPLIVVALVGQRLSGVTRWRDMALQLSSGAFVSTFLAFTLEFLFILGLLVTILAFMALQPDGLERIQDLANRLQDPAWLQDPADLAPLARSPIILVSVFLVVAGAVPLVEEAVKTVGVGLRAYRRPGLSQAFLWGLAGGAGFALAEGLFNSIGGLDAWTPIVLARGGATLLHCFTGALMGLAWYAVLTNRRWGQALGLYFVCASIHGLWNALTAGLAFLSLGPLGGDTMGDNLALAGLAVAAILAILVTLALGSGLGIAGLTRYVEKRGLTTEEKSPPISEATPAAGSTGEDA